MHFYLHFEYTVNSDYEKTKINIFNNKNVTKFPNHVIVLDLDPKLNRCWRRMLETKCVGDNFKMLVTVFAIFVTNIHYLFT